MIAIIDYEISKSECYELIGMGSKNMTKAHTLGKDVADDYRTAENAWISESSPLVEKIKSLVSAKSGLPIENQEQIHIVKYNPGGEYKEHHDFFHPDTDYYEDSMKMGGQRAISCLFYLNDDFEGGETDFPTKKIRITPKTGRMLLWSSLKTDGSLDYESLHSGLPVISGTKWIAIIWIRERANDCGCGK
jgi:prolyl 4-hydroxylase